jgi:ribose transport system ATP-binding protein
MRLLLGGLSKAFGPVAALSDVSLTVAAGTVHAILGENGAGKSTLMKLLAGAEQPDSGQMQLDGAPYHPTTPEAARRAGVGIVYQEPPFCPDLSVCENILLGSEPTVLGFLERSRERSVAQRVLSQVGLTARVSEQRMGDLSPPDRQLVAIARALVNEHCKVLILDEPTSALTATDTARLFEIVRRLARSGVAVLYISHFLEEVERIAEHFTVLRDGRSVAFGRIEATTRERLVSLMAGREVSELFPRSPRSPRSSAQPLLEVRELRGRRAPVEASFSLGAGEVLGIAGLVGSGRTELLRAIYGLDRRVSGEVLVRGEVVPAEPLALARRKVGLLSEDRKGEGVAEGLSIAENITLSGTAPLGPWGFASPTRSAEVARGWISRLGIRCRGPAQRARALSGGNQQKVALARLLEEDMDVLLLDEPTRGIDVGSRADIYQLIDGLAARGKAVLVVSSYLPELLGICDRIAVMVRGKLGPPHRVEEVTEQVLLLEATG